MNDETLTKALESLRIRITKVLPVEVRDCLNLLDEEQIWWRPNEQSNSIGNIVLHISGSLNYYLNRNLGDIAYNRDRDAEFAERRTIPKAELLAIFDDMVAKAERTVDGLTLERLG
ncbi:MAG TPA: DinB family protein, partial [Thermoanaerobaculia bacterium]|nr:DinB family protein [Thermoanaerobaculia bacterium]